MPRPSPKPSALTGDQRRAIDRAWKLVTAAERGSGAVAELLGCASESGTVYPYAFGSAMGTPGQAVGGRGNNGPEGRPSISRSDSSRWRTRYGTAAPRAFSIGGLSMLGDWLANDRSSQHERAPPWLARRAGI